MNTTVNVTKWVPLALSLVVLVIFSVFFTGCFGPLLVTQTRQVACIAARGTTGTGAGTFKGGSTVRLGGRGPSQFDCSGLITWAYKQAVGKDAIFRVGSVRASGASMQDLWRFNVVSLSPREMIPGDIVFIIKEPGRVTHGGLFISWMNEEEFKFINASSYYGRVVIDSWPASGIKQQWFVGCGQTNNNVLEALFRDYPLGD